MTESTEKRIKTLTQNLWLDLLQRGRVHHVHVVHARPCLSVYVFFVLSNLFAVTYNPTSYARKRAHARVFKVIS